MNIQINTVNTHTHTHTHTGLQAVCTHMSVLCSHDKERSNKTVKPRLFLGFCFLQRRTETASLSLGVRLIKTYLLLLSAHQQQTRDPFSGLVPQFEDTTRYFSILFPRVNSAGFIVPTSMFKSLYFFMEISDSL